MAPVKTTVREFTMLTDTRIRNTRTGTKPIRLMDGHGLYLDVSPAGGRHWRYRYRLAGKESIYTIGEYPGISLAEARVKHQEARKLVEQGVNPTQHRNLERLKRQHDNAATFETVAGEWSADMRARKWTPAYADKVDALLKKDLFPKLGGLPMKSISAPVIMTVLKKIQARGAATQALLARQLISTIFRHAIITHRAENDPAFPLKGLIARRRPVHRKHLEQRDVPDFLLRLEDYTGHIQTVIAVKLLLLTAVRPGELCEARWSEFDLDGGLWRIPAARMKMRQSHVVPLPSQALELLVQLRTLAEGDFLFPSQSTRGGAIPVATLRNAIRRMGYQDKVSPHGFRGTFSTIMNERSYRPDVIERQLAHTERNKVRASYHHAEYLPERVTMMQDWADLLDAWKAGGKVIVGNFGKVA